MFITREIAYEMDAPVPADCPTVIEYMVNQKLDFDTGSKYAYSNFGYYVLGKVIEEISGQSYEKHIRTQILGPIAIEDMHIGGSLQEDRYPGEVLHYYSTPELTQSIFPDISEPVPWQYGGLKPRSDELKRWMGGFSC
jgi:CubicO group peptidase (beta-lactamase class C family)